MKRLENKVAIITDAAQGMGESHARLFIEEGAKVIITDLNEEKGLALAKELGENALFVKQDVTCEPDWSNVINKAEEVSKMVFLASDESSYSTGSEFIIDGGLTAR